VVDLPLRATRRDVERRRTGLREAAADEGLFLDGVRIVVVDDDADTRDMLAVALRNHGAEVQVVASAAEAMTALTDVPADVLISDISMPGEDGYSLVRRLRTEGGRIRALALTALARVEDGERALAAGFQRCLAKPVDPAELATVVRALIRSG